MAMVIEKMAFNASRENYRDLISKIRRLMQQPGRFSRNRPVLPPREGVEPQGWLDLSLSTTNNRTVTLRIRKENLYLDGYMLRRDNGAELWYEFKNETPGKHLIPNSTFLDFDGSYGGLSGGGGGPLLGKKYTRTSFLTAIEGLSKFETKREDKASYLILMIVAVCEASRFEKISNSFADVMRSESGHIVIDALLVDLVHGWGDISGFMLTADAIGGKSHYRFPEENKLSPYIRYPTEAAEYVGLLLGSKDFRAGQPMVEVLSVRLLVDSTRLSGAITVTDGIGSQTLFTGSNQRVNRGETLTTLNTLQRAISATMFFDISYKLATPASSSGREYWSSFQTTDSYGRPITGGNASLALSYVIFPNAWQLTWEAKVSGNVSPINVFGTVTASYTYNRTKYETVLFSRDAGDSVQVPIEGKIPLLRLAAAAPVGVDVTVEVNLSNRVTASLNRPLVQGRDMFRVGDKKEWQGSYKLEYKFKGTDRGTLNVAAAYSPASQLPN